MELQSAEMAVLKNDYQNFATEDMWENVVTRSISYFMYKTAFSASCVNTSFFIVVNYLLLKIVQGNVAASTSLVTEVTALLIRQSPIL